MRVRMIVRMGVRIRQGLRVKVRGRATMRLTKRERERVRGSRYIFAISIDNPGVEVFCGEFFFIRTKLNLYSCQQTSKLYTSVGWHMMNCSLS